VICRSCGTEIADKAIVCYRCGTGTTDPVRRPAKVRPRRSPVLVIAVFVIALLLALYLAWNQGFLGLELTLIEEARISSVLIDFVAANA
jgi:ribosomal protein L40E